MNDVNINRSLWPLAALSVSQINIKLIQIIIVYSLSSVLIKNAYKTI